MLSVSLVAAKIPIKIVLNLRRPMDRTTNEIVARSMGRRRFNTILIGIFAATKLTESMIYGVSPTDPKTIAGGIVFLVLIGGLGSLVLARRATRVDPVLAPQGRVSNVCTD